MSRITLKHALVAAVAAGAVTASPALGKPTDRIDRYGSPTSSLAGTTSPKQDLRGEHARDAARLTPMPVTLAPDTPAQPAKALPATKDDGGRATTWLIVLVGLAGAAIAAGGTAGVRSHRHA